MEERRRDMKDRDGSIGDTCVCKLELNNLP